jgi:hypothetical protein
LAGLRKRPNAALGREDRPGAKLGERCGLGAGGDDGFDAEVIVSLDTARREAAAHRVEPAAELMLYVVHGVLHLLGHDDHALADARRMHARAVSILDGIGHRNTIRPRAKRRGSPRKNKRSMK